MTKLKPGKGFIARAALVLYVATCLIGPLVIIADQRADSQKRRDQTYQLCMKAANDGSKIFTADWCWKERFPETDYYAPFWPQYREYAVGTAIFLAAAYLLLWLLSKLVAWVWRGSKPEPQS